MSVSFLLISCAVGVLRRWWRVEEGLGLEYEGADDCGAASFDQARLIRHNQILAANGIDPSGQPHIPSSPSLLIHTYPPRTRDAH